MQRKMEIDGSIYSWRKIIVVSMLWNTQNKWKKMQESYLTSMDRDGTQVGYDIDLMSKISSK